MTINYRTRNIVIAAALAAAAVLLTVIYVSSARRDEATGKQSVTVYVAKQDFAVGTSGAKIAAGLESLTVARKAQAPQAIANPSEIKGLYAAQAIYAGEQVSMLRFTTPKAQGIRAQISGKQRAVQVAGDPNQILAGTLREGDRVDVLAAFKPSVVDREKTTVLLRNVLVLRTSDEGDSGISSGSDQKDAVVLALTDAQSQRFFFATQNGDWWLQLRPVKKPKDSTRSVDTITTVLSGGAK
jgi:Flp pilus assembly protein CpaB